MSAQEDFERLVEYIHSAIESEQPEPAEFKAETELRLRLVYSGLRRILGLSEDIVRCRRMRENVRNGDHTAVSMGEFDGVNQ